MLISKLARLFVKNSSLKLCERSIAIGSVYKSGNYQRTRLTPLPQTKMRDLRENFLQQTTSAEMSVEKWHEIRDNLIKTYKNINTNNIDATVLGLLSEAEHLKLAKEYIAFLNSTGVAANTATLGRLLRTYNAVYVQKGHLTQTEEKEVLEICERLKSGKDILDAITCEHLIHGYVSLKSDWKEALPLLDMLKLTAQPTSNVYVQLIIKACSCNEMQLGWQLLEELVSLNRQPKCEIYLSLLDVMSREPKTFMKNFQSFLTFLEQNELLLTNKVAAYVESLGNEKQLGFKASSASVNRIGKCSNCSQFLRNVGVSDAEYTKLRDSFLEKVLIRADVFQKSTPEEVKHFKRYVEETAPYDCVIDGLNVAYSKGSKRSPRELANLLAAVVRYFDMKGKSVLVLGRKHMNNWPNDTMKYVRQHANVYLTNNLTHDDPFMLYATLKSGQSTDFFSRDLLRAHAHLLGAELKSVFRRWQQEHQYSLITQTNSGKTIVKEPIRHLVYAHKVNDTWHVPLTPEYMQHQPETFDVPESWLCIKLKI